jgi:mono/diheme cytochrome c family protein
MSLASGRAAFLVSLQFAVCLTAGAARKDNRGSAATAVTFYDHVLPLLQKHCSSCHSEGGVAPMPLVGYKDVRPWAASIRDAVKSHRMPPWFADPNYGEFANDPRLSEREIEMIETWAGLGAPAGKLVGRSAASLEIKPETLPADFVLTAPQPFVIPAGASTQPEYLVFKLPFTYDRWIRTADIRPSNASVVRHAVAYVRPPQSRWLRDVPAGVPYIPKDPRTVDGARGSGDEILAIYAPGPTAIPDTDSVAQKVPTGSDLVLEIEYRSKETGASDQPEIGLAITSDTPKKKSVTLQMGPEHLRILSEGQQHRVSVSATLRSEALLIGLYPLVGRDAAEVDFEVIEPGGDPQILLKVKPYRFDVRAKYVLKQPRVLPQGSTLRWTGYFDHSANTAATGDDDQITGFLNVAVPPSVDERSLLADH